MTSIEIHIETSGTTRLVGQAHLTRSRGRITTTFLYDVGYLVGGGMSIDPALPLVTGAQHLAGLPGALSDSAPDRWGRNLITKAERARAREEGRAPRQLDDLDYLLGVSDDTRQGALRLRHLGGDEFLGEPSRVPRLIALPELLRACDELASGDDPWQAAKDLLDTGTTGLGGARPKAAVRLDDGGLAIAKFPHANDEWDVMAWEATALDLLDAAGILTPWRRLTRIGDRSALILRRFDRTTTGGRRSYISAMTAVGAINGESRDYADIAEAIRDLGGSVRHDQSELYNRVIASVALGNTDDHLRNHGFLAHRGTWALSPVFDVNPNPDPGKARATSIMGADRLMDEIDGLLALAADCGFSLDEARSQMARLSSALGPWRECARRNQISEREITMMAESIGPRLEAVARAAVA